jgi:hypothetical protein
MEKMNSQNSAPEHSGDLTQKYLVASRVVDEHYKRMFFFE